MTFSAPDRALDYLVIGHITEDITTAGRQLGGTAAYAARTARALGLEVAIVTAAAESAVLDQLEGIAVHRVPAPTTTVFENHYRREGRVQRLHSRARPLALADIPAPLRNARIVHLAPVAQEIDLALVRAFPQSFVALTPQGWMRKWDEEGWVERCVWSEATEALASAAAAVMSLEDVGHDWSLPERWAAETNAALVVTQGEEGATVLFGGQRRTLAARRVDVVDPTGAGDVFAACFFAQFARTNDVWGAAAAAVDLATNSVTQPGLSGIPLVAR